MVQRRAHDRTDSRTGRTVRVGAHNLTTRRGSASGVSADAADRLREQADAAASAEDRYAALWASTMIGDGWDDEEPDEDELAEPPVEAIALPEGSGWATARQLGRRVEFEMVEGVRLRALAPRPEAWRAFAADLEGTPVSALGTVSLEGGSGRADFAGSDSHQEAALAVTDAGPVAVVLHADGTLTKTPLRSTTEWDAIAAGGERGARVAEAIEGRGDRQPSQCGRCGRFVAPASPGHNCSSVASTDAAFEPHGDLERAGWAQGAAEVTVAGGRRYWVGDVSRYEFSLLNADPVVTFRAWEAGRRLAGPGGEGCAPVELRVPADMPTASVLSPAGAVTMASPDAIRAAAGRSGCESFHIPVSASYPESTVAGYLTASPLRGGRVAISDRGMLVGGTAAQRRQVAQAVAAAMIPEPSVASPGTLRSASEKAVRRLAGGSEASRIAREAATRKWVSGRSWADDAREFDRHSAEAARRRATGEPPVPYLRENAMGGMGDRDGGRGFGVEIEFDIEPGRDPQAARAAILRDLMEEGVIPPARHPDVWMERDMPELRGYSTWACVKDETVHGEVVSPILYDEPETWEQLETVCAVLRRHGAVASVRSGLHVHVGCADYDHTVENHQKLLTDFDAYADPLYRLATNPDRGEHRGVDWCAPNEVQSMGYRDVDEVRVGHSDRHHGLNFRSVGGSAADHVENRIADGSLDPAVIQAQMKLSVALVAASFARRNAGAGEAEPLGGHVAAGRGDEAASTLGTRRMLDRMFERDEDKAQIAALFGATAWASPRRQRPPVPAE